MGFDQNQQFETFLPKKGYIFVQCLFGIFQVIFGEKGYFVALVNWIFKYSLD